MKTLYIVATPIGNLEDITLRALRILKQVDLIAAEDTRHTKKLLNHYGIHTQLTSYFEHNELQKGAWLITRLTEGKDVALVSDAGTPGISDPGYRLIRMALEHAIPVVSIPGPSALLSALTVSGLPSDSFCFEGFIPAKPGERRRFFNSLKETQKTVILYESPKRLLSTLADIRDILGNVDIVVAREMTKMFEEVMRGKISAVVAGLELKDIKGEITVLLDLKSRESQPAIPLLDELKKLERELGLPMKEAAKIIAEKRGIPKREIYREALKLKK